MKKIFNIAYTVAVAAAMTGCADYVDTSDFKVDKPEDISTYEYLRDYAPLNTYVDRSAHPNFKLGAAISGNDFINRSSIYALACSNFDMVTPTSEIMHGSCVGADGILNSEPVRKLAEFAGEAGVEVYGHAIVSNTQQSNSWLKSLEANAVASLGHDQKIVDVLDDYSVLTAFPYELINNFAPTVEGGVLVANMTNKKHQFYLAQNFPTIVGTQYELALKLRGSRDANLTLQFPDKDNTTKFPVTTDWQEIVVKMDATSEMSSFIVDPGNIKVKLEIAYVDIRHQRTLTDAEKKGLYSDELDRYVAALMEAAKGKITTWELINCPVADGGDNGEGYYPLMSGENGPSSNFYWADALGSIDFAKVASELVNKYYTEYEGNAGDLKIYVNDNTVDDAKKAESLLYWIKKWSDAGVKIDGVGTEMHLTCNLDPTAMSAQQALVAQNLEILAKSGKLVRITALEANVIDADGTAVAAADMTLDQKKALAEFYKWVIKTYYEKVPAAQQGGICQWAIVEGAAPAGLWNAAYERTPAYAGFADGLKGN